MPPTCATWVATATAVLLTAGPAEARASREAQRGADVPLVALSQVAPDIRQSMRYASPANFTGRIVPGYEAGECWLRPAAAAALAKVQADLATADPPLSLDVFDCYRPRRSVAAFMRWAKAGEDGATRGYYPRLERRSLVAQGYIAASSLHSRGIAVDLTITPMRKAEPAPASASANAVAGCTEPAASGGIDMGTSFDCFDPKSHTAHGGLTATQREARQTLKRAMERHGFVNYAKEWWHFTYPAADDGRSFDVPVTAPQAPARAP